MSIRLRRRLSPWSIGLFVLAIASVGIVVASLYKPLPTYLVAKRDLVPGQSIQSTDLEVAELDLGSLAPLYAKEIPAGAALTSAVPQGELIPVSRLARELAENQTAIRLIPSIKPSAAVALGSFVSIWQVVEVDGIFQPEQLVARAEVASVEVGEGLFAEDVPEIEILLSKEQAMLLITALAADYEVFVLPAK
ncbi:MAG: hypothetical protein RIR89_280 [Actinomycetota bacterium]